MAEKKSDQIEQIRRELQRRSLDELEVYNPLNIEFKTIWDGFFHIVPAKQSRTFPRYIASKWLREIVTHRITEDEQAAVDKENAKRHEKGWNPLNPQERDQLVLNLGLRTDNPDLRERYYGESFKGVVREYGGDIPQGTPAQPVKKMTDDAILERLEKRAYAPEEKQPTKKVDKKEEFMEEVSSE